MKNKKILIFVFLFSISFFIFKKVNADSIDINYFDYDYNEGWYLANWWVGIAQNFKPNQPTLSHIYFKTTNWESSSTPDVSCSNHVANLCKGQYNRTLNNVDCSGGNELIATTTLNYNNIIDLDFNNLQIDQGQQYYIGFPAINLDNCYYNKIALNLDCPFGCYNPDDQTYASGHYLSYYTPSLFKTTYDDDFVSIAFTPYTTSGGMDNNGIYQDFDFWQLDGNNSGTTTQLSLQIEYQKFGDDEKITDYMSFNPFVSNYPIRISMSKSEPLLNGFYTATATIVAFYDDSIDYLDYDVIHFYINNETGSSTFPFEEMTFFDNDTYDNICDDVATSSGEFWDDFRFGIECGFRKIVYWVIYPSDKSVNNLSKGYANLKKQFPFSAYFGITDTINESIASTTVNSNGTFNIPFITATGSYYMLPVLSSSSMPNLIGESNTNLFRYSITWFMWLCAAVLIFITIKKI